MIEELGAQLLFGNLIGVFFGILMYKMANGSILKMQQTLESLLLEIRLLKAKKK